MFKKNGQSTLEYSILIIIVLGAFVAMNNYIKRGIQGRWKSAVDDLGDQYDPRFSDTNLNYSLSSNAEVRVRIINDVNGVWTDRVDTSDSSETKKGIVSILAK